MSASREHIGSSAARLGLVLALGAVLAGAQHAHAQAESEPEPDETPPVALPPARPRLALVPAPAPAPAPEPLPAVVAAPAPQAVPRSRRRLAKRAVQAAVAVALVATWAWVFMPQALGGGAAWVLVSGKSMLPHYKTGDLVLVHQQSSYHVGEVIAYRVPKGDPMQGLQVIHRIVGGDAVHGFVVKGDNRTAPDSWRPKPGDIVGAELLRIPYGVVVIQNLRSPLMLGLLAGAFAFVYVFGYRRRGGGDPEDAASSDETAANREDRHAA